MQGEAGDSVGICHHPGPLRGPGKSTTINSGRPCHLVIPPLRHPRLSNWLSPRQWESHLASEKAMGQLRLLGKLPIGPSVSSCFFLPRLNQEMSQPFCSHVTMKTKVSSHARWTKRWPWRHHGATAPPCPSWCPIPSRHNEQGKNHLSLFKHLTVGFSIAFSWMIPADTKLARCLLGACHCMPTVHGLSQTVMIQFAQNLWVLCDGACRNVLSSYSIPDIEAQDPSAQDPQAINVAKRSYQRSKHSLCWRTQNSL